MTRPKAGRKAPAGKPSTKERAYKEMYEHLGDAKAEGYVEYKFNPLLSLSGYKDWRRERRAFDYLDLKSGDRFLDIGCASGRHTAMAAKIVKYAHGVDIAESFIRLARKNKAPNLEFSAADIEHLPFKDGSFTKVLCAEVLEHVLSLDKAISEVSRVLAKGGVAVITVPNLNCEGTLWLRARASLAGRKTELLAEASLENYAKEGHMHLRQFTIISISKELAKHGLRVIDFAPCRVFDAPMLGSAYNKAAGASLSKPLAWLLGAFDDLLESRLFADFGADLVIKAVKI